MNNTSAISSPLSILAFQHFSKNSIDIPQTLAHSVSIALPIRYIPVFRTIDLSSNLRTLYAQSCWITLALSVLPRLLAQSWSELILDLKISHNLIEPWGFYGLTVDHPCSITESGFRPLRKIPHCCPLWRFGPLSVPMWLRVLSDQLTIHSLVGLYHRQQLNH